MIASLHDENLRLTRLVADLEALASRTPPPSPWNMRPLSLTALVADAVTGLAGSFAEAGVTLRTDLDEVHVDADPVRLRQIVTNQLTNALKFVPRGGVVTVRLRRGTAGPNSVWPTPAPASPPTNCPVSSTASSAAVPPAPTAPASDWPSPPNSPPPTEAH